MSRFSAFLIASMMTPIATTAIAQGYDPSTQSPLALLQVPADALAYRDMRQRAFALFAAGETSQAEPLAAELVREYPRDGENWYLLGQARDVLGLHEEAARAFEKADRLLRSGGAVSASAKAAISHMRAGNAEAALVQLQRHATHYGNRDRSWFGAEEALAPLRSDPRFRKLAGLPDTTGWTRDEGWQNDLDFLRNELLRVNADHAGKALPESIEAGYKTLRLSIPGLSDEQVYVRMNAWLAGLGQGHVVLRPGATARMPYRSIPLQFWVFPEGIHVVMAAPGKESLIGARLVSIEGVAAEEVLRRVNETKSVDGDSEHLFLGPTALADTNYLAGLRIAADPARVHITLQAADGTRSTEVLDSMPEPPPNRLFAPPGVTAPLYLRNAGQNHWHEALPEHDALYVQLNAMSDEREESLEQYGLNLRKLLEADPPENLIIDMRHNAGGSTQLYPELLRTIVSYSVLPGRRVYVLIGRRTYSAAGNFITELEQLADAVFVGEASSECCTLYASPTPFTLPYSGLTGTLPTKRWSVSRRPQDLRREMHPVLPVQLGADEHFRGEDPVLRTVARMIAAERNQQAHLPNSG